jgi:hypothetical protein
MLNFINQNQFQGPESSRGGSGVLRDVYNRGKNAYQKIGGLLGRLRSGKQDYGDGESVETNWETPEINNAYFPELNSPDYGQGASGYFQGDGARLNYQVDNEDEFYSSLLGSSPQFNNPEKTNYFSINPSNVDNSLIENQFGVGKGQDFRRGY